MVEAPPEPRLARRPRLGRSLALAGASPYRKWVFGHTTPDRAGAERQTLNAERLICE
jgi:hypothetical protein